MYKIYIKKVVPPGGYRTHNLRIYNLMLLNINLFRNFSVLFVAAELEVAISQLETRNRVLTEVRYRVKLQKQYDLIFL